MPPKPLSGFRVLAGSVVAGHGVTLLGCGPLGLHGVQDADDLLAPAALHGTGR